MLVLDIEIKPLCICQSEAVLPAGSSSMWDRSSQSESVFRSVHQRRVETGEAALS